MALNNTTAVEQYPEPLGSTWFRHTCFGLLTLLSVLGNSVVIKSIITMETRKPLTYVLVANLAFAELIGALTLPAIQVYDEVFTWPFGDFLCHVFSPSQVVSCLIITWTLAIISIYRFFTLFNVGFGLRYSTSQRNVLLLILWIAALGFCAPMFVYSKVVRSPFDASFIWCVVLFDGDTIFNFPFFKKYMLARFLVNFVIPILIMVVFYGAMVVKLKCHMTNQIHPNTATYPSMELQTSISTNTTTESSISSTKLSQSRSTSRTGKNWEPKRKGKRGRRTRMEDENTLILQLDQDLLNMIYVAVSIFIVCFLPYQVFHLLEYFDALSYKNWQYFLITRRYVFLVTCVPSALHPMCYGTMSRFYAKAFSYVFLCKIVKRQDKIVNTETI
ncbi:kappa-type opioid receptor-like [Actinia tenebrosa]|uniref:Kappa-type opioid receptor-like n=1 Tax=Actinia tenebrosa TaxID=6105 RepID=A0A6P8H301_ACTTE|nr:kappa-type opioid receptor-like [Actinia tenebrosa]